MNIKKKKAFWYSIINSGQRPVTLTTSRHYKLTTLSQTYYHERQINIEILVFRRKVVKVTGLCHSDDFHYFFQFWLEQFPDLFCYNVTVVKTSCHGIICRTNHYS